MSSVQVDAPSPPISVIESLASGFDTAASHLWLIVLPLLLDVFFLVGPRTSAEPVILEAQSAWREVVLENQPDEESRVEMERTLNRSRLDNITPRHLPLVNWWLEGDPVPAWRLVVDVIQFGVPVLIPRLPVGPLFFDYAPSLWHIDNPLVFMILVMLLPVVWVWLGSFYRATVAQQIRAERLSFGKFVVRQFFLGLNVTGYAALLSIVAWVILLPFALISYSSGNAAAQALVMEFGLFVVLWLSMFASFTLHGMFLNDRWLFPALWDSVRVVQWNVSATLFMWMLVALLNLALTLPLLNMGLATDTWLVVPAIVVHAFVNTALVAATMFFYKDRHRHWLEVRALMLERLGQLQAEQMQNFHGRRGSRPDAEDDDIL